MNSYPSMGVSNSAIAAQFYQHAASVGGLSVDSLSSPVNQPSSGSVPASAIGPAMESFRHPWMFTSKFFFFFYILPDGSFLFYILSLCEFGFPVGRVLLDSYMKISFVKGVFESTFNFLLIYLNQLFKVIKTINSTYSFLIRVCIFYF